MSKTASFAKKLVPLFNRVLVQRIQPVQQSAGGVILPESALGKVNRGTVLAVGPGSRDKDGKLIPVSVQAGDVVVLPEFGGNTVKLDGEEVVLFREEELLATVNE